MSEKAANVVMLKGLRLNMFEDGIYVPEAEQATKGKHRGKWRFKWSAKFILPKKNTPEGKAMKALIDSAMHAAKVAKWPENHEEIKIKSSDRPLHDGVGEDVTFSAYEGACFLSASKTVYGPKDGSEKDVPKRPFRVIGAKKVKNENGELRFPDMKVGEEGAPYSGCYVNLKVEFYGQAKDADVGNGNRINATILAVQFAKHGDAFGGGTRTDVDSEFDEEDGDDDFSSDDDTDLVDDL